MNVRKILLASGAAKYLGWAENKLAALETLRDNNNLPCLSKALLIDGFTVLLKTDGQEGKIIVTGGAFTHILLSSGGDSWAYNYYSDTLKKLSGAFNGDLEPGFNGRCQFGTVGHATYQNSWRFGEIDGGAGDYLGGVNNVEVAVYGDGQAVYGQQDGNPVELVGSGAPYNAALAFTDYQAVNLPLSPTDAEWNQLDTTIVYQRFLADQFSAQSFRWSPSFFFAEPMNGFYVTGWHYGKFGGWYEGDMFNALTADPIAGRAQLLGFMEIRGKNLNSYGFGYCEALTELNPTVDGLPILSFFFSTTPPTDDGEIWFNWRSNVLLAWADMRGGTKPLGTERTFSLNDPFGDGSLPTKLHMWAFEGWFDSNAVIPSITDTAGIAIIKDKQATFYRYKGYLQTVLVTDNYHSHSLSPDGTILAVFEGEEAISKVTVFDLYGEKADPLEDYTATERAPDLYSGGGFTLIRVRVFTEGATTACLIPHRLKNFVPEQPTASIGPLTQPSGLYYPAMGSLHWPRDGQGGLTIYKMVVTDGLFGLAGKSIDACFQSTIVIDDPLDPPATDRLVTHWGGGDSPLDLYKGLIRGLFSGTHPNMRFSGLGRGDINTVTLPEHFLFVTQVGSPGWYAERYVEGITVTAGDVPPADCNNPITYNQLEAVDGCGRTEVLLGIVEPILDAPEIDLVDYIVVGTRLSATGNGPFTVSATNGVSFNRTTFNADTYVTAIKECTVSGELAISTIAVTDKCGRTTEKTVRQGVVGAAWVDIGVEDISANCQSTISGIPCSCSASVINNYGYYYAGYYYYDSGVCIRPSTCTCTGGSPQGLLNGENICPTGLCNAVFDTVDILTRRTYKWACP